MRRWLLIISIFAAGCSQKVVSFVNDDSSFGSYSRYLVRNFKVADSDISAEGQRLLSVVETAMQDEMARRGYQLVDRRPDLLLRYELLTNLNSRTNVDQSPYSPIIRVNTTTFKETALLLELMDSQSRKLVWQASIDLKQGRKKSTDRFLQEAIVKMFDTYLYRANSTEQDPSLIVNE